MRKTSSIRQAGITLVEAAAVLGIASVMVGVAVPALDDLRGARHLEAAAAELRTDIHHARSTAVAMGQTVRLHVHDSTAGSCYVVHTGSAGDCSCQPSGATTCTASAQPLRSVGHLRASGIAISANAGSLAFDGFQGTVTPTGSLTVAHASGDKLRVVVNVMGRARTCRAAGTLHGHPAC